MVIGNDQSVRALRLRCDTASILMMVSLLLCIACVIYSLKSLYRHVQIAATIFAQLELCDLDRTHGFVLMTEDPPPSLGQCKHIGDAVGRFKLQSALS